MVVAKAAIDHARPGLELCRDSAQIHDRLLGWIYRHGDRKQGNKVAQYVHGLAIATKDYQLFDANSRAVDYLSGGQIDDFAAGENIVNNV